MNLLINYCHLLRPKAGKAVGKGWKNAFNQRRKWQHGSSQELDQMADNLSKLGMEDAAKTIKEGVADFQKGNMRLGLALTLVKEHLKEA